MLVFDEMRRAIEAAEQHRLPEVGQAVWRAYAAGGLTDDEAERLDGLLRARQGPVLAAPGARTAEPAAPACSRAKGISRAGSRPRSPDSMARRRRWAAAGYMPPALAAAFTGGEQAVLAVIATEVGKRGTCTLAHAHIAALAGVSASTARRALRIARTLGLTTSEERRTGRRRNDTNVVRIVSAAWISWLRLRLPRSIFQTAGGQFSTGASSSKLKGSDLQREYSLKMRENGPDRPIILPGAA